MPTHTITFTLPEEQTELTRALQGEVLHSALHDFDQDLRNWEKHGHSFKSIGDAITEIRQTLHTYLTDNGVSLYD